MATLTILQFLRTNSWISALIQYIAKDSNLTFFDVSNFLTAFISPTLPSWMMSRSGRPYPLYVLATCTTNLKCAMTSLLAASISSELFNLSNSSNSSSFDSKGVLRSSVRYISSASVVSKLDVDSNGKFFITSVVIYISYKIIIVVFSCLSRLFSTFTTVKTVF